MDRAYSLIEIKSVNEDLREIEGIASTPTTDRMGDVVEPKGAKFTLPTPFLWQHDHKSPIGHVTHAKVTDKGISVRVKIASDDEPGPLKDLLDMSWRAIKKGLVRGLSIGFRSLEDPEPIKGTYGLRFTSWELLELSAVTVPAQAEATITTIKSIDLKLRAASGTSGDPQSPGVPGSRYLDQKSQPGRKTVHTIAEDVQALEGSRASKEKRMEAITAACREEGRTKSETERQEWDELSADIAGIDHELADLKRLQEIQTRAKPADGSNGKAASQSRDARISIRPVDNPEKGIQFARLAMALAKAKGDPGIAHSIMKSHYPEHPAVDVLRAARDRGDDYGTFISRAAEWRTKNVPAGTTSDDTWAGPLLAHNTYTADFIDFLRPRTIIGRFGQGGIPSLRQIPFNVHIKGQSTGGAGHWVGEGQTKPVTKFDYFDAYHGFKKVAGISVITEELIRFSDPSAEALVRDGLANALIARMDADFLDDAAASNHRPAGLRNQVVAIASAGADIDAVTEDIAALWATADAADLPQDSAVYIMRPTIARRLGLMRNDLSSERIFPGISARGGSLLDVPIITSNYAPAGFVILVFASEIYLSDDGVVTVDASREASIQMIDAKNDGVTNASTDLDEDYPAPVPTTLVSMYQTDSVALRAHRFINWSKRRPNAVQALFGVEWGILGS